MGRRERHIRGLAEALGVELYLEHSGDGNGWANEEGFIRITRFRRWSARVYFIALHELGHFAQQHMADMASRYWPRQLEAEAEAWEWALDHALESPSRPVLRSIRERWLGSYLRDLGPEQAGPAFASLSSQIGLSISGDS